MPMDEYDLAHTSEYDIIVNVYPNDNINYVIQKFLQDNNISPSQNEYLTEKIYNTIITLRNSFSIFDFRLVTNIGGRVMYYEKDKLINCLIQVWKGNNHKIINIQ